MENRYINPSKQEGKNMVDIIRFLFADISKVDMMRFLPQIIFLTFLCLLYIGNNHLAEKKIRSISKLEIEVEDLRADYTTLKADYNHESKQSEVAARAKKLGLEESKESPVLIREAQK